MMLVPFLTIYLQDALGLGVEFATRAIGIFGLGAIVASAMIADLVEPDRQPHAFGLMYFSGAIMIGSPVGGLVLARLGGAYVRGGCFSVALLAALLYLSVHKPITARRIEQAA